MVSQRLSCECVTKECWRAYGASAARSWWGIRADFGPKWPETAPKRAVGSPFHLLNCRICALRSFETSAAWRARRHSIYSHKEVEGFTWRHVELRPGHMWPLRGGQRPRGHREAPKPGPSPSRGRKLGSHTAILQEMLNRQDSLLKSLSESLQAES